MADKVVSVLLKGHTKKLLESGKRLDGRTLDKVRDIKVETGILNTAEGSAKVELGGTKVLCGIKILQGTPYPDRPKMGVLTTTLELDQMASPDFDQMSGREDSIELARVTDRGIRESGLVDLSSLCIEEGKKVWVVHIDITVIDYDGNAFDAASYAAAAALRTAKLPLSRDGMGEDVPLKTTGRPISVTNAKIDGHIIVDPGLEEEQMAQARLTVTTDDQGAVRAMQKGGLGSFSIDEVKTIIKRSQDMGAIIREQLP